MGILAKEIEFLRTGKTPAASNVVPATIAAPEKHSQERSRQSFFRSGSEFAEEYGERDVVPTPVPSKTGRSYDEIATARARRIDEIHRAALKGQSASRTATRGAKAPRSRLDKEALEGTK